MIKLGEIREREPFRRISFKEWIAKGYASAGKYSVRLIFPPSRYPSFSVIFDDPSSGMQVRVSIKADKMREVLNALGLKLKKADLPPLLFEVGEDEYGLIYGLDIDSDTSYALEWRGTYWIRRKAEAEAEDLDIEL